MATPFIDSRFPGEDYDRMAASVAESQQRRASIAGPPLPAPVLSMQGVEKRAADALKMQQNQGPMPPMIVNGGMQFQAPAQTPRPAPVLPAPMMAGQTMTAPAPMMMMSAPNSLSRGAAPQGLGGVAPVPVGRSRYDPTRIAEQMVRRRDPRGFQFLAGQAMQGQSQDFQREMFGAQQGAMNERDATNFQQGLQMFGAQQAAMNERDATNFQQQQQMFQQETQRRAGESDLEWQRRREAEAAQSIVSAEPLPMMGGMVPMVKRADGTMSMAGGFQPAKTAPSLPPGMVPKRAVVDGVQYETPKPATTGPRPFTGKIQTEGGETVMDKATGKSVTTPVRQFTVMEDPATGRLVKRYVEDADGNGVPDNKEQSAPSWLDWLNSQPLTL